MSKLSNITMISLLSICFLVIGCERKITSYTAIMNEAEEGSLNVNCSETLIKNKPGEASGDYATECIVTLTSKTRIINDKDNKELRIHDLRTGAHIRVVLEEPEVLKNISSTKSVHKAKEIHLMDY